MKKLKINSLEQLLKFVSDPAVTLEDRYKIFLEAMRPYNFFVMTVRNNPDGNPEKLDNRERVISEMRRIISQIKADPESHPAGFVVTFSNN
jgi:hypothetical protein